MEVAEVAEVLQQQVYKALILVSIIYAPQEEGAAEAMVGLIVILVDMVVQVGRVADQAGTTVQRQVQVSAVVTFLLIILRREIMVDILEHLMVDQILVQAAVTELVE